MKGRKEWLKKEREGWGVGGERERKEMEWTEVRSGERKRRQERKGGRGEGKKDAQKYQVNIINENISYWTDLERVDFFSSSTTSSGVVSGTISK